MHAEMKTISLSDPHSADFILPFYGRISSILGSVDSAAMMTYEVGGKPVIACDFGGNLGDVTMTLFPNGETEIPGELEFERGRKSGERYEVELEFAVADFSAASFICGKLIDHLPFDAASLKQTMLRDAANLQKSNL